MKSDLSKDPPAAALFMPERWFDGLTMNEPPKSSTWLHSCFRRNDECAPPAYSKPAEGPFFARRLGSPRTVWFDKFAMSGLGA
jgi:hypothetical protein